MQKKAQVIAIEEHYFDSEIVTHYDEKLSRPTLRHRLENLGAERIKDMDEGGIDIQVLSHAAPATHLMEPATAVPLARGANDRLRETVRKNPQRFAAFLSESERACLNTAFRVGLLFERILRPTRTLDSSTDTRQCFERTTASQ